MQRQWTSRGEGKSCNSEPHNFLLLGHICGRSRQHCMMHALAFYVYLTSLLVLPAIGSSIGAYIRAGLGVTTTRRSTLPPSSSSSSHQNQTLFANTTTTALKKTGAPLNTNLLQWQSCAESWAKYESVTTRISTVVVVTSLHTTISISTVDLKYGTAKVYNTVSGIAVARGTFTPTKTVRMALDVTEISASSTSHIRYASPTTSKPSCSSIAPSECSLLYDAYVKSYNTPGDTAVPDITPIPSNSPACPAYYYRPWTSCTSWRDPGSESGACTVQGNNVQIFYWPPKNVSNLQINATVTQSYAPGVTFTSPSIYMSFDYLAAIVLLPGSAMACTACGKFPDGSGWGCASTTTDDGDGLMTAGTSTTGVLLSK